MNEITKKILKSLINICLGIFCLVCLSSFSSLTTTNLDEDSPIKIESRFIYYSEYQFYKDAYNYRINNKIEIPTIYYDKLDIPNPIVSIVAPTIPIIETPKSLIPPWVLKGMLMRETTSYYSSIGSIIYVDKRRGSSGERGPFQMKRICFEVIHKSNEQFWKLEKDTKYAEELTIRYLMYLYNGPAHENWKIAIGMYNVGPSNYRRYINSANEYYNAVKNLGEK
jgi:hypothetical protein